jgi:hypothetical protein
MQTWTHHAHERRGAERAEDPPRRPYPNGGGEGRFDLRFGCRRADAASLPGHAFESEVDGLFRAHRSRWRGAEIEAGRLRRGERDIELCHGNIADAGIDGRGRLGYCAKAVFDLVADINHFAETGFQPGHGRQIAALRQIVQPEQRGMDTMHHGSAGLRPPCRNRVHMHRIPVARKCRKAYLVLSQEAFPAECDCRHVPSSLKMFRSPL